MAEKRDMLRYVGWYDDASQDAPAYDPPHDGPCIVCNKPLTPDDVRTCSLMWEDRSGGKSLFYRLHRTCGDGLSEKEVALYDGAVLDSMPLLTKREDESQNGGMTIGY